MLQNKIPFLFFQAIFFIQKKISISCLIILFIRYLFTLIPNFLLVPYSDLVEANNISIIQSHHLMN